ncbi:uncharacterized protein EKO05_0003261 [Ascochyta rabiei]|nr:uncharacterized protein EKO05_0003261 [Ascochyta rabiei]UPX12722.1 hypothetical protein EKO05_0003261 [Ascochyta rabiei]
MTVGLAEGNYPTQKQYERVLCRLLVKEGNGVKTLLTTKSPGRPRKYSYDVSLYDKDVSSDYIAAAAAVGNLQALRTALDDDPCRIWDESPAFGYPLAAAAAGSHHEIVRAIVKHFEQTQEHIHMDYVQIQFRFALDAAFEAKDLHTALLLLQIFNEYGAPLGRNLLRSWTLKAVGTESGKVIRQVLNLRQLSTVGSAFETACISENLKAVREFISEGLLPLHCSCSDTTCHTPIHVAASFGSTEIVEELIHSGADPNGCFVRDNKCRPLWIAILKNRKGVVRVLLRHSANPEFVLSLWDEEKDLFKDKRASIGVLLNKAKRRKNYYVPPKTPRIQFAADAADLTILRRRRKRPCCGWSDCLVMASKVWSTGLS